MMRALRPVAHSQTRDFICYRRNLRVTPRTTRGEANPEWSQ